MKKLLLLMITCCFMLTATFAQEGPVEKKLGIRPLKEDVIIMINRTAVQALDCNCDKNILKDGDFRTVIASPGSISTSSPYWKPGSYTSPQYSPKFGGCDSGFISMWGNKVVGEFVYQSGLTITANKHYRIKFNARFPNTTGAANPYVQLGVTASNTSNPGLPVPVPAGSATVTSQQISSTAWASYSMLFNPLSNFTTLSFYPVNGNSQDDGDFVSWIQLDNICIEEIPDCKCGEWRGFSFSINQLNIKAQDPLPTEKDVAKILGCGKTVVIKAGNTLKLYPLFVCSGPCAPVYKASVLLPNGTTQALSGSVYTFNQTTPGYYIITVTPYCGDKPCPPCRIRVFVTPGCNGDILFERGWEQTVLAGEGRG